MLIMFPASWAKYIMLALGSIGSVALSGALMANQKVLTDGMIAGYVGGILIMIAFGALGVLVLRKEGSPLKFLKYLCFAIAAGVIWNVAAGWGQAATANRVVCVLQTLVFLAAGLWFTLCGRRFPKGTRNPPADSPSGRKDRILRLLRWHSAIRVALLLLIGATLLATVASASHKDVTRTDTITVTEFEPYAATMPAGQYVSGKAQIITGSFTITTTKVSPYSMPNIPPTLLASNRTSAETYYTIVSEDGEEGFLHGNSPAFTAFRGSSFALFDDLSMPWPDAFEFQGKTLSFPADLDVGIAGKSAQEILDTYTRHSAEELELIKSIKGKTYVELDDITYKETVVIPADPIYQTICVILWIIALLCANIYFVLRHWLKEETRNRGVRMG